MRNPADKKNRFTLGAVLPVLFLACLLETSRGVAGEKTVLASTSLTGAVAMAAGASDVRVLTPAEWRHPPEYDLRPSDWMKFEGVRVVVYAGYEKMVTKLLETSRNKNIVVIQIDTTSSPENLITQARKISAVLQTEKEEQVWEQRFAKTLDELQKKLAPYSGKRAVVHRHAQPFSQWAGLSVVYVVSPGELTPRAMGEAIAQHPEIVVDILHMLVARAIAENAKCRYVQTINFPGVERTVTLDDLFEYNASQLIKAFQ